MESSVGCFGIRNSSQEVSYSVKHEMSLVCCDYDRICHGEGAGVPPKWLLVGSFQPSPTIIPPSSTLKLFLDMKAPLSKTYVD